MNLSNKKTAKRISVWTLVFTLALTLVMMSLTLPTQGKNVMDRTGDAISDVGNGIEEAMSDVGDAVSDVGNGIGEAVSDIGDVTDAQVKDSDGIIENESDTDATAEEGGMPAWLVF